MSSLRSLSLLFSLTLLLSACGGAKISDDGATGPGVIDGRAIKGVIQSAQVDAYALEAHGRRHLGRTRTNKEGEFSLNLEGPLTVPVLLRVTPPGDGSGRMICDAVSGCEGADFGDAVPLAEDFKLTTLITPGERNRAHVAVTPLTHIAADWARSMPGPVNGQRIALARSRVAGLMQLDPDFAFQRVPDITSSEVATDADTRAGRHALMAAAFAEHATRHYSSLQQILDGYCGAFVRRAGQLPHARGYSLRELFTAAHRIAAERDILAETRYTLDVLIAGLHAGSTEVASASDFDRADFERAREGLDDLDHYLRQAGINASGDFLQRHARQFSLPARLDWMNQIRKTRKATAMAGLLAGVYQDLPLTPASMDMSQLLGYSGDVSAVYDFDDEKLRVQGTTASGQSLDLSIAITPITGRRQVHDNLVQGTIARSSVVSELQGQLTLDFQDTPLFELVLTLESLLLSGSATLDDLKTVLTDLVDVYQVRSTVTGDASIVDTDTDQPGFRFSGLNTWRVRDLGAVDDGGEMVKRRIAAGAVETPNGGWIEADQSSDAPGFGVSLDGNSISARANLLTRMFDLPRMEIRAQGSVATPDGFLQSYKQGLVDAIEKGTDGLAMVKQLWHQDLPLAGFLVRNLEAEARLAIDDPERGRRVYQLTLDSQGLHVSRPDSTENAYTIHAGRAGTGYITAGDTLVATVTPKPSRKGVTLYFVDGTKRSYFLAPKRSGQTL